MRPDGRDLIRQAEKEGITDGLITRRNRSRRHGARVQSVAKSESSLSRAETCLHQPGRPGRDRRDLICDRRDLICDRRDLICDRRDLICDRRDLITAVKRFPRPARHRLGETATSRTVAHWSHSGRSNRGTKRPAGRPAWMHRGKLPRTPTRADGAAGTVVVEWSNNCLL